VHRRASKDPQDGVSRLEFYKDPFVLVLLMLIPAGLVFLISTFIYSASFPIMLVAYTLAFISGVILLCSVASHKIILKEHVAVFMHGAFFRKKRVLAYEKIGSIELSAVTDGITVVSADGSLRETYTWMNNTDNLYKILQQRVVEARQTKQTHKASLTLEDLADKRLSGELTDEEFATEINRIHAE
jgi:hypothetical protein